MKSDVLGFILINGWFEVSPSGTELEIKLYFEAFSDALENAQESLKSLLCSLSLNIEAYH